MNKKEEEALLKVYAQSTGKPVTLLKELLEKAKAEAKEAGVETDHVIKGKFRKKVNQMLFVERLGTALAGNTARKTPFTFRGFLLGADAIRDIKEQMRRKALRYWAEVGDLARVEGYVDENGNPLDWRPTIRDRRGQEVENTEYHSPIIGHRYVRDIFGVAKKEGDEKAKLFQMTLWEGFATKFTYRPFVPVEFTATIKSEGDYYVLNPPRASKGEKAFRTIAMDIDCEAWIKEAGEGRTYPLVKLSEAVKNTKNAKDPWIFTNGIVDYIDPEINPKTGSRSISIADVDSGMTETVRVFIPKDFPLAFREYSEVIVFGRPKTWKRSDEEEDRFSISGLSIYPVPGKTVEEEIEESRTAQGEAEEEEGWDLWGD